MTASIRTVVAGVSHPADDDPTLRAAAEIARWTGAALHLVHAFTPPLVFTGPEMPAAPPDWLARYEDERRAALEATARRAAGPAAVCHTVVGAPAPALLAAADAARADLVVVGASRHGRLARAFLGTTAQRVLRGAGAPVLVVRAPVRRPLGRLLTATDLSEECAAVHEAGLDAVEAIFGPPAEARALLVVWYPALPTPIPPEAVHHASREELDAFLRARRERTFPVDAVVRLGQPAAEITAAAGHWGADLVVLGTHARGWAARQALGSVAEAAMRDCPANVLAIPPRAARRAAGTRDATAEAHSVPA